MGFKKWFQFNPSVVRNYLSAGMSGKIEVSILKHDFEKKMQITRLACGAEPELCKFTIPSQNNIIYYSGLPTTLRVPVPVPVE